jgi:hypothetical protein
LQQTALAYESAAGEPEALDGLQNEAHVSQDLEALMSFFATLSGADVSAERVPALVFTPAFEAQAYIRELAVAIAALDSSPVYLCDDGQSGTSHDFICDAEDFVRENQTLAGSPLEPLLDLCDRRRAVLRVWWADNDPNAYMKAVKARNRTELLQVLLTQSSGPGWNFRYGISA